MERYDSYKNSGIKWINEIPSNWEKSRIRMVGDLYGGLTGKKGSDFNDEDNPSNKPFVPFTNIFNNTYISKDHFQYVNVEENENQNRVLKNDLFFLMSSESYEDLGKCSILLENVEELYLNSFCKGFRIKDSKVYPLFLNYQLLGSLHKEMISVEGNGFTRINLRQNRLLDIPVFIPPLFEQHKIVSFLDTKTNLIDSLIEKTQQKIELLKEKRLKLIEEIILNNDIERVRLENIVNLIKRPINRDNNETYNKIGMYNWGRGIFKYPNEKGFELGDSTFNFINEGDLILSGQFSWEGSVSLVEKEFHNCISSHRFHILTGKDKIVLNEYLWSYFTSQEGHFLLTENSFGSSGRNRPLNIGRLLKEKIPVPELSIQLKIRGLVQHTIEYIKYSKKRIELLKEYRQSLISEVVTGKRKVV